MDNKILLELVTRTHSLQSASKWVEDRVNNLVEVLLDDDIVCNENVEDVKYSEAISGLKASFEVARKYLDEVGRILGVLDILKESE